MRTSDNYVSDEGNRIHLPDKSRCIKNDDSDDE